MTAMEPRTADESMSWTLWPAAARPFQAVALVLVAVLFGAYCTVAFHGLLYGLAALVVVIAAAASFLLPCRYTLDAEGLRVRGLLTRKSLRWDEAACYLRGPDFIAVSTEAEPTLRSISAGMILKLRGNGDAVEARLAKRIPKWEKPPDGR